MTWTIGAALGLSLVVACSDQSSERRGGGGEPNLSAGEAGSFGSAESGNGGTGAAGVGGGGPSGLVQWCDAFRVINCACQQCHQNPPLNGAPIPLMTYEDTQAPYPLSTSTKRTWQEMQASVSNGSMPFTADKSIVPAVKPLTTEQRATLLDWFAQGAHAEGGTDCHAACDWAQ